MYPAAISTITGAQAQPVRPAGSRRILFSASGKGSHGLYTATWNARTGEVGTPAQVAALEEPVFLALGTGHSRGHIYAVSEGTGPTARVTGYRIERGGKSLRLVNSQPAGGDGTTHLSVSPNGQALAVANYTSGSVSSFRILPDGGLSPAVSTLANTGHGPNQKRQGSAHAHSARYTPDNRFLLLNDLGLDRIYVYLVDAATAALTPHTPPFWQARPGSGPRHIAFHPNGRWVYSVNELDSTVDILRWDARHGTLTLETFVSTLPPGFPPGTAFAGEIAIAADGGALYVGNRVASDTIAVFTVGDDGRTLHLAQLAGNGGKNTRYLTPDPSGNWMLLCNYGSGDVVTAHRNVATGELASPAHRVALEGVMCGVFLPA